METKTKKITTTGAQGDVLITRVSALPKGLARSKCARKGSAIVAHSETGHHHRAHGKGLELWEDPRDPLVCYHGTGRATGGER